MSSSRFFFQEKVLPCPVRFHAEAGPQGVKNRFTSFAIAVASRPNNTMTTVHTLYINLYYQIIVFRFLVLETLFGKPQRGEAETSTALS